MLSQDTRMAISVFTCADSELLRHMLSQTIYMQIDAPLTKDGFYETFLNFYIINKPN